MKTMSMSMVAVLGLLVQAAAAGECGCNAPCDCGCCEVPSCECGGGKTCKLICETKKVKVICWGCECEDFCVGGCSEEGCTHMEGGCAPHHGCDGCANNCEGKSGPDCVFRWKSWIPGCAEMRTRKKLVKYEVTKEVPSFRWEVVDTCAGCGGCHAGCACNHATDAGCTAYEPASAPVADQPTEAPPAPAMDESGPEAAPVPPARPTSIVPGAVQGQQISFIR